MSTQNAYDGEHGWPAWTGRMAVGSAREELCAALLHSHPQMTAGQANAQAGVAVEAAYAMASSESLDEGARLEAMAQSISNQAKALVESLPHSG